MAKQFPISDLNPVGNKRVRVMGNPTIYYADTSASFEYPSRAATYGTLYESTLHELCIIRTSDDAKVPIHEYADMTALLAAGVTYGLINACVNLEVKRVGFIAEAEQVDFEVLTPAALSAGDVYIHPAVDTVTSKLHPFKVLVNSTAADAIAKISVPPQDAIPTVVTGHFVSEYKHKFLSA